VKAIILAAGAGSRLGNIYQDKPKCLIDIEDNTLLEIQINNLYACGVSDISIVRGFKAEMISIPGIRYYENKDYQNTNILHSLFCAEDDLNDDVVIIYSDIIFEEQTLQRLIESKHDIAVGTMVNWEEAIKQRDQIALEELEMIYFDSENRVKKTGKQLMEPYEAKGQFMGMLKCSKRGAEILKRNYHRLKECESLIQFGQTNSVKKAWITDLLQEMTELGVPLHCVMAERGWMEIDTIEDYDRAQNDTQFIRRVLKTKTNWSTRANLYNELDWVNRDVLLDSFVEQCGALDNKKVIDLGTGTGKVLMALHHKWPEAEYYGVDFSAAMLEKIDPKYKFNLSQGVIENLDNFENSSFNLATARMVLHHSTDLKKAAQEVHRILKPGGSFILCEGVPPNRQSFAFYEEMFRYKEERHSFLTDDLINLLLEQGFQEVDCRTIQLKDMSINNWLDNSGLPFRNTDIIKKMHLECEPVVKNSYNMRFLDSDMLMDWKFVIVSGIK